MAEFIVNNEQDIRNLRRLLLGLNEHSMEKTSAVTKEMRITASNFNFGNQSGPITFGNNNVIVSTARDAVQMPTGTAQRSSLWRFRLRERQTLKTKVKATLVVRPPNQGDLQSEYEVEIPIPKASAMGDLAWYYSSREQNSSPDLPEKTENHFRLFGERAFEHMFSDPLASAAWDAALQPGQQISWTIQGSCSFQQFPWEWLRYDRANLDLAREFVFSRRIVDPQPLKSWLPQNGPLRILWVTARKVGDRIPRNIIQQPVAAAISGAATIDVIDSGQFADLVVQLQRNSKQPTWHIVHLDLHGWVGTAERVWNHAGNAPGNWKLKDRSHRGDLPTRSKETGFLFFEDNDRNDPVLASELAAEISKARIPLVVLNACHSAAVPPSAQDSSLTAHLVQAGAFSALGFHQPVTVAGAARFFSAFYERLAHSPDSDRFDDAVKAGRLKLHESTQRGELNLIDWPLPVWYSAREFELQ
jgi:hypothetical protein